MIIKLTYPTAWSTSNIGLASNFIQQMPGCNNRWGEYEFYINDDIDICDYWIVYGNLDKNMRVRCRRGSIFILSEEADNKKWDTRFLKQFDVVIGSQDSIDHHHYFSSQYVCPWQVKRSYDNLMTMSTPIKQFNLSAVVSDMTWKEGHKKRFAFVNQLKGHFKKELDWYGRGNIFINDKWDGLINYRYSIAIENTVSENYWTEKIMDCFLSYTMPIYSGCPNISDYFPEGSYLAIDMNDLEKTIQLIEDAISSDLYTKNLPFIIEARRKVLSEYQFFPKICSWLGMLEDQKIDQKICTLKPERFFTRETPVQKLLRISKQLINYKLE